MSKTTNIAWTDSTFNGWIGCTKVSPACDNCYAERDFDHRYQRVSWGAGNERSRTSAQNWNKPRRWNRDHEAFYQAHGRRQRVFCSSLSDVFDNEVPDQWREDLFELIEQTPHLDWLLLTKRIGNVDKMRALSPRIDRVLARQAWLGISVIDQKEVDRDIPKLLSTQAHLRFVSMEPLLGPTDITRYLKGTDTDPGLDWVITGGESGPKARPMHPSWPMALRDQCRKSATAFFFKQWGEWVPRSQIDGGEVIGRSSEPVTVPSQLAGVEHSEAWRLGTKRTGHHLDGQVWQQTPGG